MSSHLLLFFTFHGHDFDFFSLKFLVITWIGCLHKEHVIDVFDVFDNILKASKVVLPERGRHMRRHVRLRVDVGASTCHFASLNVLHIVREGSSTFEYIVLRLHDRL